MDGFTPDVLYEDNHLLIVNKPAGLLVQPDATTPEALETLLKQYIKQKYDKPGEVFLGVCHRIDRPVSGIVIFAKTSKALARMNELFKTRNITKTYWAVVENKPPQPQAVLKHWLKKDGTKNKSYAYTKPVQDSSPCELSYQLLATGDRYYLLEVNPVTGRHHQIRVQLAHMGCPIKGDIKYGAKRTNRDGSICLHARSIAFTHPVKNEPVQITAPVPEDALWKALESMAG